MPHTPPGLAVLEQSDQNLEKTSERKITKPDKSQLSYAMWSIWDQAQPSERELIVNIANTILASRN
jgi:hypothetical protein